ncbi:MAG: hypothetical protein AAFN07_13270 [Pseudomonadota bacterium]
MSFGRYQFLSWARRGIADAIRQKDTLGRRDGAVIERARVPVGVELTTGETISQNFALMGPGDVIGINPQSIIRTEPRDGIGDYEPNYLPYVEFYDEDFPFRYTPAAAASDDLKLRPWITLVVLKPEEFVETSRREPLSSIQIINPQALQPNDELHLWCHMHSNLPHEESQFDQFLDGLEEDVKKDPDGVYSRLLCPRQLEPKTHYHAFLIPTFETGRRAGLGQSPASVPAQQPAWPNGATEFPVYHRFSFATGKNFDFEYLVKQLQPRVMDERVGVREMDCSQPGFVRNDANEAVRSPSPSTLLLEGAVIAPSAQRSMFPPATRPQPFFDDMEALVNLNKVRVQSDDQDPYVSIPFYGMFHAMRRDNGAPGKRVVPNFDPSGSNWYNELNRDPRTRVPAGFGKRVVQENQETFSDAAWQQLGDVLEANRKLKQARFTSVVMQQLYEKNVASRDDSDFLSMVGPMTARVRGVRGTVHNDIVTSRVSESVFSGVFARMTRPTTSIARGLSNRGRESGFSLLTAVPKMDRASGIRPDKEGNFQPVSTIRNLDTFTAPSTASAVRVWSTQSNLVADFASNQDGFTGGLPPVSEWLTRFDPQRFRLGTEGLVEGALPRVGAPAARTPATLQPRTGAPTASVTPRNVGRPTVRPSVTTRVVRPQITGRDMTFVATTVANNNEATRDHNAAVRGAYSALNQRFDVTRLRNTSPALSARAASRRVDQSIAPNRAYHERLRRILKWPPGAFRPEPEAFLPAMAYPDLPSPTYKYLLEIDKEFLLPNLELIENNTLSLLKTNQKFIESYLVGMNYEMGRELMWREYPTDMRGSYFRQFWDVSGFVTPDTTPQDSESLKDIKPIHQWRRNSRLGKHNARDPDGDSEQLVFVVRGDLLRKFPNTVIFAQKALPNPESNATTETVIRTGEMTDAQLAGEIKFPLYQAQIDPDIKLLGFDLTVREATGATPTSSVSAGGSANAADRLGWYFIIAEVPGEPRFGMDISFDPNEPDELTWNDLSWKNFQGDIDFVTARRRPNGRVGRGPVRAFPSEPEVGRWGHSSADMAAILLQRPAMIAVHAKEMLETQVSQPVDRDDRLTLFSYLSDVPRLRF